jgi:hypothetical protein
MDPNPNYCCFPLPDGYRERHDLPTHDVFGSSFFDDPYEWKILPLNLTCFDTLHAVMYDALSECLVVIICAALSVSYIVYVPLNVILGK